MIKMDFFKTAILASLFLINTNINASTAIIDQYTFFYDDIGGSNDFNNQITNTYIESFEDPFPYDSYSLTFHHDDGLSFSITSDRPLRWDTDFPLYQKHGTAVIAFEEQGETNLTFAFHTPIDAFGMNVHHLSGHMEYADDNGLLLGDPLLGKNCPYVGTQDCDNYQFFGIASSNPFSVIHLTFGSWTSGFLAIDKVVYSSAVPLPASTWLFISGLTALFTLRKSKLKSLFLNLNS